MNEKTYNASEEWKQVLSVQPYEHHCYSIDDFKKIKSLGRIWRKIFQAIKPEPSFRFFELGYGGGIHLASLAVNGFDVSGIDVSDVVASSAENYLQEVNQFQSIKAKIEVANIFEYHSSDSYEVCFHFGVVEHFLELTEREQVWNKLYDLTKPGGWIVSVVPCGQHFMRKMVREKGLCGYIVPEIDYSCASHRQEFENIGLTSISTIPWNYFPFLSAHPSKLISKIIYSALVYRK